MPNKISDHCATYINKPFEYPYFVLLLEMYGYIKMQVINCSIKISDFDWSCLHQVTVNEASSLFANSFIEYSKLCISSKIIVVQEDAKTWYDCEIRRNLRKRDRLKKTALKSGNRMTVKNTNIQK